MARRARNISGQRFGLLVAMAITDKREPVHGSAIWLCVCDCGVEVEVSLREVKHWGVRSCGCLPRRKPKGQPLKRRRVEAERAGTMRCSYCEEEKILTAFTPGIVVRGGGLCQQCQCIDNRVKRLRRYGISVDQYDALLLAQGGCCSCCGAAGSSEARQLSVDHDHETGAIRGIICHSCNVGIGHLGDNADGVRRALRYLERTTNKLDLVGNSTSGTGELVPDQKEQTDAQTDRHTSDIVGGRHENRP